MQKLSDQELIEKYLDGSLTESEQVLFDEAMTNASFRSSLLFHAQMLDQFKSMHDDDILKQIKEQAESKPTNIKTLPSSRSYTQAFKIAAAVLVLLSVVYFLNPFGRTNYDSQFQAYMIDYPIDLIERGGNNDADTSTQNDQGLIKDALKAYANNDYSLAISKFEALQSSDERILLNQASAYLREQQTNKAIDILRPLCSSQDKKVSDNANWYLALSYVQNNEIQRAIDLLNLISKTDDSLWQSQAKSLLTELM